MLHALCLLALGSCQASARFVDAASESQTSSLLGSLKPLAGRWELRVPGAPPATTVFAIGAGGTIVRETMMPGDVQEMTNVYHMDGPTLLMTHYCGAGNQPRMRATARDGNSIQFVFEGASDLQRGEHCMGSMKLTFVDADTITQDWTHHDDGAEQGTVRFELVRKK